MMSMVGVVVVIIIIMQIVFVRHWRRVGTTLIFQVLILIMPVVLTLVWVITTEASLSHILIRKRHVVASGVIT